MSQLPATRADAHDNLLLARQLSDQYRRAESAMLELVRLGAMLTYLRDNVVDPRVDRGLAGWLERYCPEISQGSAYRYMRLADGIREHLSLPRDANLSRLLAEIPEQLRPAERSRRRRIEEFLSGRSQRQLIFAFSARGGAKGAGGDMALDAWLREYHPDLVGTARADLAASVAQEYREYAESAARRGRSGLSVREYNATEFFARLEHDLTRAASRYKHHLHVSIPRLREIDAVLSHYRETIRSTIERG